MGAKGKAIYQPKGKAAEYSPWACNFYTGCSNDCQYCYCKRGVLNHTWSQEPKLKSCFRDEKHALDVFRKELMSLIVSNPEIKDQGILFSFTTDPLLEETKFLTYKSAQFANEIGVPVKILTKRADFVDEVKFYWFDYALTSFGFTLTGTDDLEPNASTNAERIRAMREIHDLGFKIFASIEPVIKIDASYAMINAISGWCDLIMVGLLSGKKEYGKDGVSFLYEMIKQDNRGGGKFYLKDSFVDFIGLDRSKLTDQFVTADYNMFERHETKE